MRIVRGLLIVVVVVLVGLIGFDYVAPEQSARLAIEMEQHRSGLHEARASIPGFDISYLDGGSGEPLLLIHGFGADKNNFTRVARFLTPQYRVVIPDVPGFGDSSKPASATYAIAEQVERLRAFAQGLGLKRVHLGGSSMGGWISMAWAAKYPDEVASLWLLDAAGTKVGFDSELTRHYKETGEILLVAKTPAEFERIAGFVMSQPPFLPYSIRHVLAARAVADYPLHRKIFEALGKEPPVDLDAITLKVPALIVWGDEDRALNAKAVDAQKALIPGAEVVHMAGIGHLPMIEACPQSAKDYLAFRGKLAAAR